MVVVVVVVCVSNSFLTFFCVLTLRKSSAKSRPVSLGNKKRTLTVLKIVIRRVG